MQGKKQFFNLPNNFSLFFTLLFILFVNGAFSQTGILKGTIKNMNNNETVVGASVYNISDITNGVASDVNGAYSLNLNPGSQAIICSFTGMVTDTFLVMIESGKTIEHNFDLAQLSKNLNVVVVSAGKYEQRIEDITVSMEVIKPTLIENKNTVNITSVLEQTPGLTILDQEPQIRGGSGFSFGVGSRVATLIDGLPILSGDAGRTEWQFIPVENIEQIEVIKGASSVLYGSSALSGTINFRTAYPKEKFHTYVRTYGGVYDAPFNEEAKWWDGPANFSGIAIQHSEKMERIDLVVGANAVYDHGYIGPPVNIAALPFQDTTISGNDVASRWGRFNMNLRYRFKKLKGLSAGVNGNALQSHTNFSLVWANDSSGIYNSFPKTMTLSDSKYFYVDPFINYTTLKGTTHNLRGRIYYAQNDNGNEQSNKANVYIAEYRFNKIFAALGDLNVTGGLFMNHSFSTADLYNGSGMPKNESENYAGYAQLEKKFINRVTLSGGIRGEYFLINEEEKVFKPIMRAGLNVKITKGTFLRASYGQGYRYPTITEKFINTNTGGIGVFSNPQVKPETSWSTEVGIKQGFKIGNFLAFADVAAFEQHYSNTIEYIYAIWEHDSFGNSSAGFKFINTGRTRVKGIEFSLMGEGKIFKDFSLAILGGYTYTLPQSLEPDYIFAYDNPDTTQGFIRTALSYDSTSTDYSNNILKYRFNDLAKVDIELTWKFLSVGYSLRYYGFMKNIDKTFYTLDEPYFLPTGIKEYRKEHDNGSLVHDVRFGAKLSKVFKAAALVNNVANLEYSLRPLKIESPRTFTLQLVAEF